jgi:hypothetical protein
MHGYVARGRHRPAARKLPHPDLVHTRAQGIDQPLQGSTRTASIHAAPTHPLVKKRFEKMSNPVHLGRHTCREEEFHETDRELLHDSVSRNSSGARVDHRRGAFVFMHRVRSRNVLSRRCPGLRPGACMGRDRAVVGQSGVCPCGARQAAARKARRCVRYASCQRRCKVTAEPRHLRLQGKIIPSHLC